MGNLLSKIAAGHKGEPIRVCMLGLDAAGKTTVLQKLKLADCTRTLPTIGFNVETVTPCKGLTLTIWDIGGQDKIRQLWKHYYTSTQGIIFVVDSADKTRFGEAVSELNAILQEDGMRKIPIVVLANKQDLPEAVDKRDLATVLELDKLPADHSWHIENCCAVKGVGVYESMKVLSSMIKKAKGLSASAART
uniref:ADP-ribosylation factor 6-like n=1 Tax=Styela clava TaxID=7725 RepID=UPI00193A8AED|nr:ADP-ribosylation factor 6-like [Styela clava]